MTTTYADREYLLPKAKRAVAGMTPFRWPDAGSIIRDREGHEIGFYSDGKRGPYIIACKRSLHKDVYASFMPRLIGKALVIGRQTSWSKTPCLCLFVGAGEPYHIGDAWVFDARRVANQATERERSTVDSKRERNVPIFDVSARAHGVGLGDYLAERKRLPGPAETRPTTFRTFGIERGEV